jgi:hypothetical protein
VSLCEQFVCISETVCRRTGDGKHFPRNPRAEEMLARLAVELVKADRNN